MTPVGMLRLSGLCAALGGFGLVAVTLLLSAVPGQCVQGVCPIVPTRPTMPGEATLGVVAVTLLVVASVGLVAGARRRAPVEKIGRAAAVCGVVGSLLAVAALMTSARTQGETWLMPVFVFPALLLIAAAAVLMGFFVLRAELVPRRLAIALIVAAALLLLYTQQSPGDLIPVPFGLVCLVTGVHLVVRGGRPAIRPVVAPG